MVRPHAHGAERRAPDDTADDTAGDDAEVDGDIPGELALDDPVLGVCAPDVADRLEEPAPGADAGTGPFPAGDEGTPGGRWPGVAIAALLAMWGVAAIAGLATASHQLSPQFPSARAASAQAGPAADSGPGAAARPASARSSPGSAGPAMAGPGSAPPPGKPALAGTARRPAASPPPLTGGPAGSPPAPAAPGAALPAGARPSGARPATAGWWTYADPGGFTIQLPPGWSAGPRTATHITFSGPRPGFTVLVWWTTTPQPDQLADWRQQAAYKAQTDPTYRQLAIRRVSYRGYNCANWEFSNSYHGQAIHVLDHGFIVTPGALAYAIELYGPEARWRNVRAQTWAGLLDSFTPAGRGRAPAR